MNLLVRLKADLVLADKLMKINQSLKTSKERKKMGFLLLVDLIQDLKWAIRDLETIY